MQSIFSKLLRSNFRCGRMLHSRTANVAGCFVTPMIHLYRV
jgi:hypothetical protein